MTGLLDKVRRKTSGFARQPRFVQLWFVPLWCLLGISRAMVLFVPFRRLASHLGRRTRIVPQLALLSPAQATRARQVSRAIQVTIAYTPWKSNCFAQAIAARLLLGLYGVPYALLLGLMPDPPAVKPRAHAWVASGDIFVTGGNGFGHFTVVGCFVSAHLAPD